jgi:cytoskeletal protein RodZ
MTIFAMVSGCHNFIISCCLFFLPTAYASDDDGDGENYDPTNNDNHRRRQPEDHIVITEEDHRTNNEERSMSSLLESIISSETIQAFWDVWMHRIMVTILIVIVYELFFFQSKTPKQRRQVGDLSQEHQTAAVETDDDIKNTTTTTATTSATTTTSSSSSSRFVTENQEDLILEDDKLTVNESDVPKSTTFGNDKSFKATNKKKTKSSLPTQQQSTHSKTQSTTTTTEPPRIQATTNQHPGMDGFAHWYEVETSLYRIYTLTRKDGQQVVPPYTPHSYRGNISIYLDVKNRTNHSINVYWVDYKGKHVLKGTMKPNHTWTQTTWIDHPWVFEDANDSTVYLYYIPYRVIPTLPAASTTSPGDGDIGQHKFALTPSKPNDPYMIGIQDDIMPHPASTHFHQPLYGITWTLTHMSRCVPTEDPSVEVLQKYLTNIMNRPEIAKYRQIRIASPRFKPIWESPMRGLLLSIGFVERGRYAELGCHDQPLSRERVQEVALLSYLLSEWKNKPNAVSINQPQGAVDGFGRAGYGRAGTIN